MGRSGSYKVKGAPPGDSTGRGAASPSTSPKAPSLRPDARIAELEARDALKTQFLANISHDLRTPLTAVITHAEILRDGILGPLSERQLESITGIINGGRQLLEQVGEILTYARGAANQLTLVRREVEQQFLRAREEALSAVRRVDNARAAVADAQRNADISVARYHGGEAPITEVTDALTTLAQLRASLQQALFDFEVSRAQLQEAAGQ